MRNTLIFLLFLLLPLSCGDSPAHHALDEAEKWLDRQPDSVRHWLEKMEIPAGKDSFERARYQLIQATLSVKRGNGDIADEHLPECISVFLAAHDSVRLVRSYYQLALACQYRKQYKKADSLFTEGARYATGAYWKSLLGEYAGYARLEAGDGAGALRLHLRTLTDTAGLTLSRRTALLAGAGQACLYTGRMDSALLYYRQAAGLCIPDYLADRRSYLCRKIIDLYRMKGEFRTALEYLKTNIAANRSRREVPYYLLTKARLCLSAGETDSARLYLTRAAQSEDGYAAACAFEYLARLYEPDDPERSFYARQSYGDLIHSLVNKTDTEVMRMRFQEEKLRNENNELKLKKQQQDVCFLSLGLAFCVAAIVVLVFYIRERKKKINERLARLEQERELISLRERTTALREQLFRRLSASGKIPSLTGGRSDKNTESRSRLTPADLEELVQTVDEIWPGFSRRLREAYPLLRDKDIPFCCLLKCGITTKDLASIYYVTPSAISKKKGRMKQEQFGVSDEEITLEELLARF